MQKKTKNLITAASTFLFPAAMTFFDCLNAFAADGSGKTTVSKGVIILVMVAVFIFTAAVTGIMSFRIRKNKLRNEAKDNSSEQSEE